MLLTYHTATDLWTAGCETALWLALGATLYTWAGYPASLWVLSRERCGKLSPKAFEPTVSIIIAARNEEAQIRDKLRDCSALRYRPDALQILVASDGSTDNTETIVRELSERDPRVELVRTKGRAGKSQAQNVAAQHASGEILLFTDVETRIPPDALQPILGNFSDPQVGLVTAVVNFPKGDGAVAGGQGFYWRYETFLRQMESDIGILATASGQLLAVRRSLFRPIDPQHGDDCIIPLDVCLHGFRVVQEPRAVVTDVMPHTIEGELRARIRMTTRNWTGTFSRPALLNPLRFPGTAWSLVSHKLLRWLTPFLLVSALISNTVLVLEHRAVLLWFTQAIFYLAAIVGWLRERKGQSAAPFSYAFCFCLANVGFMLGIVKAFRGQRTVAY